MPVNVALVELCKMGLSHLAIANALQQFNVVAIWNTCSIVGNAHNKYTSIPLADNGDKLVDLAELQAVVPRH